MKEESRLEAFEYMKQEVRVESPPYLSPVSHIVSSASLSSPHPPPARVALEAARCTSQGPKVRPCLLHVAANPDQLRTSSVSGERRGGS
eukprot:746312-Hanusia_phi.AAC.1